MKGNALYDRMDDRLQAIIVFTCLTHDRPNRRRQPMLGEDRRVDAAYEISHVLLGAAYLSANLVEGRLGLDRVGHTLLAGTCDLQAQPHEPLLRAVVQVAFDTAALGVARGDDPRSRLSQQAGLLCERRLLPAESLVGFE